MTDLNQRQDWKQRSKAWAVSPLGSTVLVLLGGALLASLVILGLGGDGSSTAKADNTEYAGSCGIVDNYPDNSCIGQKRKLCPEDQKMAEIAWKYVQNNYQEKTGLVNSVDQYTSTTMWDTGSALAATVAAREFELIDQKTFDDMVVALLNTLSNVEMFEGIAPNKAYNTISGKMVDYGNQATDTGIGISTLDLARLVSWLNILSCLHPKHTKVAERVLTRWNYCDLIKDGQMFGMGQDPVTNAPILLQEGRLGYEQYAGKIFQDMGYDMYISGTYHNKFSTSVDIMGVPIIYDVRDPRKLGAYNYVVTESYAMDAMENGIDAENQPLLDNILEVQRRRYDRTGIVTAISEDNVDRDPYFIYNTIFAAGSPWNAITDTGRDMGHMKSTSTKAAVSMALLYSDTEYGKILYDYVSSAYDPERGWYSGIYETGLGYNRAITANTNGVIMGGLLYKMYGPLNKICKRCGKGIVFDSKVINDEKNKGKCLPGQVRCDSCT